jgi:GNAT superfamily N-acetyltransferase
VPIEVRPFVEADRPRLPEADRQPAASFVAETDGRIVGWGQAAHQRWQFHPDKYWLRLEVDPGWRRQGIGASLLGRVLDELLERDALLLRTVAIDGDDGSTGFLEHRGFRDAWRNLESRLDVAAFDPAPLAEIAQRVTATGVTIRTMAGELADRRDPAGQVYALYVSTNGDQASLDPITAPPIAEFLADVTRGPRGLLDAWFLAFVGDRLVGLSTLERLGHAAEELETGYTGVDREYRGRGIALALKLQAIAYARDHGYRFIRTDSSAANERMLAINAALGFVPTLTRITYELGLR